jgi:dynein heavy chain
MLPINPKVVSTNEFYGVVHIQTREWIDGLFSCKLRDFSKETDTNPKWIILDGDLDANWIESMNSVMDDNKLLTLASNERITLKPHMKLIFEIRNLKFATPATVSRAGILYISDDDGYQWRAYVKSWIAHSPYEPERKEALQKLFNTYIEDTAFYMRKNFKNIVPTVLISQVMNICKLLETIF